MVINRLLVPRIVYLYLFHFSPKNYWNFWEKVLIPWQVQGKNKISLVYLLQKASNCSKNDGKILKRQRAYLRRFPLSEVGKI